MRGKRTTSVAAFKFPSRKAAVLLASSMLGIHVLGVPATAGTLTTVYSFCAQNGCADGVYPAAGVIRDTAGNLYGTTTQRGGAGTVYELSPQQGGSWQYRVLHNFCSRYGCADGDAPFSDLILDKDGNLYGTTEAGGREASGTAFKLIGDDRKWKLKLLHAFCARRLCHDGGNPTAGLAYAGEANSLPYDGSAPLYGTTSSGGYGMGTIGVIFELKPKLHGLWDFTKIHKFCTRNDTAHCKDGVNPAAALTVSPAGEIFGIAYAGGKYDRGVVFKLSFDGAKWNETVLHQFCSVAQCADGAYPMASLAIDANGNVFGTTSSGGSAASGGVVFELSPADSGWQYNVLHTFCQETGCPDGANPYAGLSLALNGDLLGTTYHGGNAQNAGVAFRLSGGKFEVLYEYCSKSACVDGANPVSVLTPDGRGDYFGATVVGGQNNFGTVFELTP